MKRLALVIVVLLSFPGLASVSFAQRSDATSDTAPLNKMPKDLEERFALSGLPPHLLAGAAGVVGAVVAFHDRRVDDSLISLACGLAGVSMVPEAARGLRKKSP